MRIATFNVNSIRSRLAIVLDWMEQNHPDVLCVQETKVQDASFPAAEIEQAGWQVVFAGEKSYNGVALLSPHPIQDVMTGFDDGGQADASRLIAGTVQGVRIVNTYVPQGRELEHEMYAYKLRWFDRLKNWFATNCSPDEPLVWCGDMNVARQAIDVKNAANKKNHVCYHADVRAAFEEVVAWGFTDVFRAFHANEALYSFFDYRVKDAVERNIGWRIDYILVTDPLAATCRDSYIDLAPRRLLKPSDHTVLVADFS
jgi:exodeoxyribonuclease-3